jgi:integral membrane protein (TIGR01906 family)
VSDRADHQVGPAARVAVSVGTVLAIVALAVPLLLTPLFIHPALEAAGAPSRLGLDAAQVHELSDRSVQELLLGPGTFAFDGPDGQPFYDASERSHLADARTLLWLCLAGGAVAALAIGLALLRAAPRRRASLWRLISRAGLATTVGVAVLGIVALVAFDTLFTLFHQVFFPGGNWSFDPATQRLVQLYPFGFWQIAAAAAGTLVFLLGLGTWLLGRSMTRRTGRSSPDQHVRSTSSTPGG